MALKEWTATELGDLAKFVSGGTPSKGNADFWGGNEPWISGKDLKQHYISKSVDMLSTEGFKHAKKAPKGATLILVRGMTLLKDFPVGYATREVAFNQDLKALIPKANIDGMFLSFLVAAQKHKIMQLVSTAGHGTGRLDTELIKEFPVDVPPKPEQRKIAKMLSTWDEAIATTEQLLSNSQRQKKALMQQLLTGKKRLPDFGESTLGGFGCQNLPPDWAYIPISKVAKEVSERNIDQDDLPVLSCSKYEGFVDSLKYFKKKVFSDDTSNYKIIHRGQFGFPANHVEEGSIGLQGLYEKGIVSPIYVVFSVDESKVDNFFLYKVLKTDHYRQIFAAATSASVDRRGSLRWKPFSSIKIFLPSLEEQQAISRVIRSAEKEIELLKSELNRLKGEKKALMQQLLTGKRRLKLEEEAEATTA